MAKITRQEIVDRLGEPDFSFSNSMYWYDKRLRAINLKSVGYEIQPIKIRQGATFVRYSRIRKCWVEFTIQKKLKQHYQDYINNILLGEESEPK